MKKLILTITLLNFITNTSLAQFRNYQVNSTKIVATANGINLTKGHYQKSLRFLEFIFGTKVSASDEQSILQEIIKDFNSNPQGLLDQIKSFDTTMAQFYQMQDISIIAKLRSAMISQIAASGQNMPANQQPFIIKLLNKYVPVLANDTQNMLAFTYRDFEGLVYLMQFNAQMSGQNVQFTQQQLSELQNNLVQQFYYMTLEQKQSLCSMQVIYQYTYKIYNNLTPEQKQQWQNAMMNVQYAGYQNNTATNYNQSYASNTQNNSTYKVQWPAGITTKAQKQAYLRKMRSRMSANSSAMNTYYNSMMGNHAVMLNTIENFGDTGTYWKYNY